MAFYSPLGDGSFEVETDDGRKLRTAMDQSALEAMGLSAKPPSLEPDRRVAGPGGLGFDEYDTKGNAPPAPPAAPQGAPAGVGPSHAAPGTPQAMSFDKPKPMPVQIPQGAPASQQKPRTQEDAVRDLVASQIVTSSRGRPGTGKAVPVSKSVTVAPIASTEDLEALSEQEIGSEGMAIGQAEEQAARRGSMLDQAIAQNDAREQKLQEQYAKRQAVDAKLLELQTNAEKYEREANETQTLNATDEYFKNAGGPWARVLAGLVTVLGGLGQAHMAAAGMQSPNQGLEAINRGIKERADMLKQEYEQKQAAGRNARNAYSDMLQAYGTPEMALQALQDRGEAIADRKLAIMAEREGNQDKLNQVYQWQAQRAEQRRARIAERNAQAAGQVTTQSRFDQGSPGGTKVNLEAARLFHAMKPGGDQKTMPVRLPDGSTVDAPESIAKDAQEKIKAANAVAEATARIRHLRSQPGAKTDPDKRATIQTAASQLQLALKKKETLGTLDKGSVEFLNQLTGDPTGIIDLGGADAKLNELEGSAKKEIDDIKRFDLGVTSKPAGAQSDE